MQFILGPRVPAGFEDWQLVRVGEALHLTAHSHLNVEQAANTSVSATLIGYLLDPRNPHVSNADILDSLISSIEQGEDLFEFVYPLGGRWALLVDDGQGTRLLGDAAGISFRHAADSRFLVCLTTGTHCKCTRAGASVSS